jgi:hypothetical protein
MNKDEQIRAWALAIALLIGKPGEAKATRDGSLEFSPEFWTLIKAVENYLAVPAEGSQTPPAL